MTATADHTQPRFARMYVKASQRAERRGIAAHRQRLLDGLTGKVLEIGAGNGLSFSHYPTTVTRVAAIEPESTLRAIAAAAAESSPVPIDVQPGNAAALEFADAEFDAVITSLVLCSVPDQPTALAEIRRVLRPGGELRFLEHVIPRCQPKRALTQAIDRSGLWPRLAGGCHPARDTQSAIHAAGFTIQYCDRFMFSASTLEPSMPHILGIAGR